MNFDLSNLENSILKFRMKLYTVQNIFGAGSREASYISIIVDECIYDLRHTAENEIYKKCEDKLAVALQRIGRVG